MAQTSQLSLFQIVGPGILLAATGIGAGDLLTGTLAGSAVGPSLLWAVVAGVLLKWVLSEGIARWQLATGSTVVEGWVSRLGRWVQWAFFAYLLLFTLVVGGALISACGVAGSGLLQLGDSNDSKIIWGIVHSMVALGLVWYGSFALFERLISVCIGIMFVTVVTTAVLTRPDWSVIAAGFIPSIPAEGRSWLIALIGGVGGTVTLLSYGYWIREEGRQGIESVRICRIDLACGYVMTAIFGCCVVIIGSRVDVSGQGSMLALQLADRLAFTIGDWGRPFFLVGFWGTVFASMLGVWQSIPYMFADFMQLRKGLPLVGPRNTDLRKSSAYRAYLLVIATVPIILLWTPVRQVQLIYAISGALFLPILALTLLIMNNKRGWVGADFQSSWPINMVLGGSLAFFAYVGGLEIRDLLFGSG